MTAMTAVISKGGTTSSRGFLVPPVLHGVSPPCPVQPHAPEHTSEYSSVDVFGLGGDPQHSDDNASIMTPPPSPQRTASYSSSFRPHTVGELMKATEKLVNSATASTPGGPTTSKVGGKKRRAVVGLSMFGGTKVSAEDLWAQAFAIRVVVPQAVQSGLLGSYNLSDFTLVVDVEKDAVTRYTRLIAALTDKKVARVLKVLAGASLWMAPLMYSLGWSCEVRAEQQFLLAMQSIHLPIVLCYAFLATGRHAAIMHGFFDHSAKNPLEGTLKIAVRNLILDVFSIPAALADVYLLVTVASKPPAPPNSPVAQAMMFAHMLKAWRFVTPEVSTQSNGFTLQMATLFIHLMFVGHFAACIAYWMAVIEHTHGVDSWADKVFAKTRHNSCLDLYAAALYFCTYSLTSIGYGDFVPAIWREQMLCVLFMLASQMFAAKILSEMTWITATHQHWKAQHHAQLTQTAAALSSMGVRPALQQRVLAYQEFLDKQQKERRAQECLQDLSRPLREELKLVVYYDLVTNAAFLQEQPTHILRYIISSLVDLVDLPCDCIIRKGDIGTELFFLRSGCAGVFLSVALPEWEKEEVHVIRSGSYFGEIALLSGARRQSWIVARTYCICASFSKNAMEEVMSAFPGCVAGMVSSLKTALGLKQATTWREVFRLVRQEFLDEDALFDFACSGTDGEGISGVITWKRWEKLMQRLHVSAIDRKLMWVKLDTGKIGEITFVALVDLIKQNCGIDESIDLGEAMLPPTPPARSLVPQVWVSRRSSVGGEPSRGDSDDPESVEVSVVQAGASCLTTKAMPANAASTISTRAFPDRPSLSDRYRTQDNDSVKESFVSTPTLEPRHSNPRLSENMFDVHSLQSGPRVPPRRGSAGHIQPRDALHRHHSASSTKSDRGHDHEHLVQLASKLQRDPEAVFWPSVFLEACGEPRGVSHRRHSADVMLSRRNSTNSFRTDDHEHLVQLTSKVENIGKQMDNVEKQLADFAKHLGIPRGDAVTP